jgi:large subunit ribosomal protein L18
MAPTNRASERAKRHRRLRRRIRGTAERPRLCVTKTLRHLYAQIIDDDAGKTLVQVSSVDAEGRAAEIRPNITGAKALGQRMASAAQEAGVRLVVFDRGGYLYHGVVSAFAEACREGGLEF